MNTMQEIRNTKSIDIQLPLKLWLQSCKSFCKSTRNIIDTFSSFWLGEWIFLIKSPYIVILLVKGKEN